MWKEEGERWNTEGERWTVEGGRWKTRPSKSPKFYTLTISGEKEFLPKRV